MNDKDPGIFSFKEHLSYDPGGILAPIVLNIFLMLRYHPDWRGVIGLAQGSDHIVALKIPPYSAGFSGPWTQRDNVLTACWLQQKGLNVTPEQVAETVLAVATANEQGLSPDQALENSIL